MASPVLSVKEFQDRLQSLLEEFPGGAVVFDADGTLWKHDVGCMVYDYFCDEGLFLSESEAALTEELMRITGSVPSGATANLLARELQRTWRQGSYEERLAAEMQVWAYVGYEEGRFRELVREALLRGKHSETLHSEILDLAEWVRTQGGRALIVSASPLWVVEEATSGYGFSQNEIAAGIPATSLIASASSTSPQRVVHAGMAAPLPYGPDKVVGGKQLIQDGVWLAALGDSAFDLDMMAAAKLAAGIGHKPEMLAGLARLPHGVRLHFD